MSKKQRLTAKFLIVLLIINSLFYYFTWRKNSEEKEARNLNVSTQLTSLSENHSFEKMIAVRIGARGISSNIDKDKPRFFQNNRLF